MVVDCNISREICQEDEIFPSAASSLFRSQTATSGVQIHSETYQKLQNQPRDTVIVRQASLRSGKSTLACWLRTSNHHRTSTCIYISSTSSEQTRCSLPRTRYPSLCISDSYSLVMSLLIRVYHPTALGPIVSVTRKLPNWSRAVFPASPPHSWMLIISHFLPMAIGSPQRGQTTRLQRVR